ncbi:JAB domain-containing protein [Gallibacterium anatis]|uniref:DNA repair protein RadC n=1 Tax=Gallibacterium anatis TaxID=750 RepID=A0A921HAA2_9PAST|nr:DNA repair protein RadC [Gallibacterium anatis]HJF74159.1 DNA repair protein RadC [Gallibacterium anatis]
MNLTTEQKLTINNALTCLEQLMESSPLYKVNAPEFTSPALATDYCRLKIGTENREVFLVLFLSNQHKLICADIMYKGSINISIASPRGIIKKALDENAAAIIVAHNHPSGYVAPSAEDISTTSKLKSACELFDIKLLDHLIVSMKEAYSFAEQGLLN